MSCPPISMPQSKAYSLELCVDTADGLRACQGRVDRIELCSALSIGGLTPSAGLIEQAKDSDAAVHAMIRPRAGDFDFSPAEVDQMCRDIDCVRKAGLSGVVVGATKGAQLDVPALHAMRAAAGDLSLTLHRVIDILPDPIAAIQTVIDLGFARILSSGGAHRAVEGVPRLRDMVKVAEGNIDIMAGSGVRAANVAQIARATGIRSFHASCSVQVPVSSVAAQFGFGGGTQATTSATEIEAMRAALDDHFSSEP